MLPTDRSVQWSAGVVGVSRPIFDLWITSYSCLSGCPMSSVPDAYASDVRLIGLVRS